MIAALHAWIGGQGLGFTGILLAAFVLGVVHGITPDEHTWPITFSYAIGAFSSRRGLIAGATFSLGFTVQRAIASELAYLALGRWLAAAGHDAPVYVVVGLVMALAGGYVLRYDRVLHLDLFHLRHRHRDAETWRAQRAQEGGAPELRAPTPRMALIHGFIAGWGVGAFALFIYTVLAPASPGPAVGWLPGFVFGLGTAVIQAPAGALFGRLSRRIGLTRAATERMAHVIAGRTLFWGGLAFAAAGALLLAFPRFGNVGLATHIGVPNLGRLGVAFVLVVVVVIGIGGGSIWAELRRPHPDRRCG